MDVPLSHLERRLPKSARQLLCSLDSKLSSLYANDRDAQSIFTENGYKYRFLFVYVEYLENDKQFCDEIYWSARSINRKAKNFQSESGNLAEKAEASIGAKKPHGTEPPSEESHGGVMSRREGSAQDLFLRRNRFEQDKPQPQNT